MQLQIPRLRRWLALGVVLLSLVVAGVYLHRRHQARDVLKQIPARMDVEIQQTAEGFKVSKSDQGRTLFTIQASKAVQFRLGGRAELHNVAITLFGRDSSRYDQIYGDDFVYDPQTGDVTAQGQVRIDLEANPEGLLKPDQSKPAIMKDPIHLVTRGLVFNQKTGNAFTNAKVELQMPQATGSATGVHYSAKDNVLTLDSRVDLALTGSRHTTLKAARAVMTKTPREILVESPHLVHAAQQVDARRATLYLRDDNTVDHVIASDEVQARIAGDSPIQARAERAEFTANDAQDGLVRAEFRGDVHLESAGLRPSQVSAGRVLLDFEASNRVSKVHTEDDVKVVELLSTEPGANTSNSAQAIEIDAPAIDFFVAEGQHLDHAETSSGARIAVLPTSSGDSSTVVTAGSFQAKFDDHGEIRSIHGAPDAKVVSRTPGQPDRISTGRQIDASFRPAGGIEAIVQQGNVEYIDGERQARADRARYTPGDQTLELTGWPRFTDKGLVTTARIFRMNRATGEAVAEGSVKSTYSDLREQPTGALLAAASPIHVTARSMNTNRSSAVATYTGDARLWQDANVVEAATIQFDRDHRSVVASGNGRPVSTVLVQIDKHGNVTPVSICSARLTYKDDQRRARFEGGVTARGADVTITADQSDAFLIPRNQEMQNQSAKGQGQLERMVAERNVVVQEPGRRALGENLTYTVADDKFVLSGGTPSIFDAEHGKIRGDSLTFFRRDDRVLVEGRDSSPTVTQTRVAR